MINNITACKILLNYNYQQHMSALWQLAFECENTNSTYLPTFSNTAGILSICLQLLIILTANWNVSKL